MTQIQYLLLANLLMWAFLFAYLYFINKKQNRIEEKIGMLEKNE